MMIALAERQQLLDYFDETVTNGARRTKAANVIGLRLRTLQRWRQPATLKPDGRTQRQFTPGNKLTDEERDTLLAVANSEEFRNRTPHQIVPMLAERGDYIASESSFYRVLRKAGQLKHRHASRAANPRGAWILTRGVGVLLSEAAASGSLSQNMCRGALYWPYGA